MTTGGYTLIDIPTPKQRLVHVHADRRGAGPRLSAGARDPRDAARLRHGDRGVACRSRTRRWRARTEAAHEDFSPWQQPPRSPGRIQMGEIIALARRRTCRRTRSITNGAGNFATWLHRFHRYRGFGTQLAPTSGSMGYGFPAALGAKLRRSRSHPSSASPATATSR